MSLSPSDQRLLAKVDEIVAGDPHLKERFIDGGDRIAGCRPIPRTSSVFADFPVVPERSRIELLSRFERSTQLVFDRREGGATVVALGKPISQAAAQYAQPRSAESQPLPQWPTTITMQWPPPTHIVPARRPPPEPFYQRPAPGQHPPVEFGARHAGRVVFARDIAADSFFSFATVQAPRNGTPIVLEPGYVPSSSSDLTLVFESRFESGNLLKATKMSDQEYNLTLQTDLFTNRHTQWFYFSVANMRKGRSYGFNITNMLKPDSLYSQGMQPVVYSTLAADKGWRRVGHDIRYFRNEVPVPDGRGGRFFSTLRFKYPCEQDGDLVYFAHCYPYTYTDLQTYLTLLDKDPLRRRHVRHRPLCRTLAGNVCDLLTITTFDDLAHNAQPMAGRKGVVITARVHPGETNASWMMKGVMDFLTSEDPDAYLLRDHFVFKLVPMQNPDGVIVGNYRTSLSGADLNRAYKNPLRNLFPTVAQVKHMMHRFMEDREIVLYVDLHGHSRKNNIFMYGCDNATRPKRLLHERVFPYMLGKNGDSLFSYKGSKFGVQKSKESCGRIVAWRELNIVNSFTLEASFAGSTLGALKGHQFSWADFQDMGVILLDTLLDYCDPNPAKKDQVRAALEAVELAKLATGAASDDGESSDDANDSGDGGGSDSSDFDGAVIAAESHYCQQLELSNGDAAELHRARLRVQRHAKIQQQQQKQQVKSDDRFNADLEIPPPLKKKKSFVVEAAKHESSVQIVNDNSISTALSAKYAAMSGGGLPLFSEARLNARKEARREKEANLASTIFWNGVQKIGTEAPSFAFRRPSITRTSSDYSIDALDPEHDAESLVPGVGTKVTKKGSSCSLLEDWGPLLRRAPAASAPPTLGMSRSEPLLKSDASLSFVRPPARASLPPPRSPVLTRPVPSPPMPRAPLPVSTAAFSLSDGLRMRRRDGDDAETPDDDAAEAGNKSRFPAVPRTRVLPAVRLDGKAGAAEVSCRCGVLSSEHFVRQIMHPRLGLIQVCDLCGLQKLRSALRASRPAQAQSPRH